MVAASSRHVLAPMPCTKPQTEERCEVRRQRATDAGHHQEPEAGQQNPPTAEMSPTGMNATLIPSI